MPRGVERILCAAVYVDTGKKEDGGWSRGGPETGLVFCGLRHGDCIGVANAWWSLLPEDEQEKYEDLNGGRFSRRQGFLTSHGRYVSRKEAQVIALEQGQVVDVDALRGDILFSEDLY